MTETPATAAPCPLALTLRPAANRAAGGGVWGALRLAVPPGGLHVIAGASGSGKTALVEMISMARPPSRGVLELFGEDTAKTPPSERFRLRRRIGVIFQDLRLIDGMTATDNLAIAVRAAGGRVKDAAANIAETLAWVGLGRHSRTPAGALTADGRRRLALARAVINRPGLIIADGAVGQDDGTVARLLGDLRAAGAAVLVTTRDSDFARRSGAQVTWTTPPAEPATEAAAGEPAW